MYNASILLKSTRCVSTTPSESNEASRSNSAVRYVVGVEAHSDDAALASQDPPSSESAARAEDVWSASAVAVCLNALCIGAECVGERPTPPAASSLELPLPSVPQITRRMGNSLAQLLTRSAVLIAAGLAAVGGGKGWMLCGGAVDARRIGGGRVIRDGPCGFGDGSIGEVPSAVEPGWGVVFVGLVVRLPGSCD